MQCAPVAPLWVYTYPCTHMHACVLVYSLQPRAECMSTWCQLAGLLLIERLKPQLDMEASQAPARLVPLTMAGAGSPSIWLSFPTT